MANSGSGSDNTNTATQNNYNNTGAQYNNCTFSEPPNDDDEDKTPERRSKRLQELRQWLDPPDHTLDHDTARARWEPTTGEWLLRHETYKKWKSGLLWLNGKAGCGKTVLCSTVIEDLRADGVLLYFYFTFSDTRKQTLEGMLRSLAAQVMLWNLKPLRQLKEEGSAGVFSLTRALQEAFKGLDVKIVIDALDECPEDNRLEVLRWISRQTVMMFVTSRDVQEIADYLGTSPQVRIQNSDIAADIALYAERQLTVEPRLARFTPAIKTRIRENITQRADGMFRWAALLLGEMIKLKRSSDNEIAAALSRFPQKLDDVYKRILIECSSHRHVYTLLQWIAYSTEPLNLSELAEVLTVNWEHDAVDPQERDQPLDILRLLSSLVVPIAVLPDADLDDSDFYDEFSDRGSFEGAIADSGSSFDGPIDGMTRLRLAHFTVQEYLESTRILEDAARSFHLVPQQAHYMITRSCLCYLTHNINDLYQSSLQSGRTYPLLRRATSDWIGHSLLHDQTDVSAEVNFLERQVLRRTWAELLDALCSDIRPLPFATLPDHAITYASLAGSAAVLKVLLRKNDLNATGDLNVLWLAVSSGMTAAVRVLLEAGAEPNRPGVGSPLKWALIKDNIDIARLLLRAGATPMVRLPRTAEEGAVTNDTIRQLTADKRITVQWVALAGRSSFSAEEEDEEMTHEFLTKRRASRKSLSKLQKTKRSIRYR